MNIERYFGHIVTVVLLGLSVWQRSALLSYSAVLSLGFILLSRYLEMRTTVAAKPGVPEDVKRQIQDLNARLATIEYGVKTRGF